VKKYIFFLTSLLLLLFASCEKKEKKWKLPPVPAGIQTQIFSLGDNYENQIWFNIADQQSWINHHNTWDIGFASGAGNEIVVNYGMNDLMSVAKFPKSFAGSFTKLQLDNIKDSSWKIDNPTGEADSQVFNKWSFNVAPGSDSAQSCIYIIRRGDASLGNAQYVELNLISRIGGVYHFGWYNILETPAVYHDIYLKPDPNYNFIYYNFGTISTVVNEPVEKNDWDIVFTTYKKYIPDPSNGKPYPYTLRGVLSNRNNVGVYDVPNVALNTWDKITLDYAKGIIFSSDMDEIGYDWKLWNMTANKYTMANKIYIIKDTKDNYFKMKFVDFYDDNGKKGYPKMAWELLK
jgi:HmuY protein